MGMKKGSTPRDDVRQGGLDDAIFAASFGKLVRNDGPLIYRDPDHFFRNTHPTTALTKLCKDVFGRLTSITEAGAILRLSTRFGGGKTHALMTLWHLAKVIGNPSKGTDLLAPAGQRPSACAASTLRVPVTRSLLGMATLRPEASPRNSFTS